MDPITTLRSVRVKLLRLTLWFFLFCRPVWGQFEADVNMVRLTTSADFIFKGTVINVEYRNSEIVPLLDPTGRPVTDEQGNPVYVDGSDMPHTFVTYEIETIYKGFPPRTNPSRLTLRFEGGQSDKVSPLGRAYLLIESYPLFDLGDRDILFVKGNGRYPCPLTDCHSGRFRVLTDPNDPTPNLIFSELGMEIRYIIPVGISGRAAAWQIVFGPQRLLPQITTHTMGEIEIEDIYVDPADGTIPPPEQNPRGTHFFESRFDTYLNSLVNELFTPEQLRRLPPVVTADITQNFRGYVITDSGPPEVRPTPAESERPWLDELTPEELAEVLEAERIERQMLSISGGNPVLPQTPCELQILRFGPLPGDISGPQGRPDCQVDFFDFSVLADNWLLCNDPIGSQRL